MYVLPFGVINDDDDDDDDDDKKSQTNLRRDFIPKILPFTMRGSGPHK